MSYPVNLTHALPPRPSTATVAGAGGVAVAGPSRLPSSASAPAPSLTATTTANPTQCSICSSTAKYTCPRCSSRTCSLPCSKTHKSSTGCSGQRDPAKFVPLKEYGQGAWAGDYVYLEEGRRKVSNWGKGVKVEEINPSRNSSGPTRGRGRGRGGLGNGGGGWQRRSKVDILGNELAKRGCQVSFMPEGMARRKANQSGYNPKTQQIHISIQLSIPKHLLDPSVTASTTESKVYMHPRNLFSTNASPTLHSLLPSSLPPTDLIFVLPFHATPSRSASTSEAQSQTQAQPGKSGQKLFFPPLEGTSPLGTALKGTAWIEFPTVYVYPKTAWETSLDKGEVDVVPFLDIAVRQSEGQRRDNGWVGKRRAHDVDDEDRGVKADSDSPSRTIKKAKVADEGLLALGEYNSEDEEDDGDEDDHVDDVEEEDQLGNEDQEEDLEVALEEEAEEDEPSLEVLQAVGMAIAADFG